MAKEPKAEVIGCPYCSEPIPLRVSEYVLTAYKVGACKDCNISIEITQRK